MRLVAAGGRNAKLDRGVLAVEHRGPELAMRRNVGGRVRSQRGGTLRTEDVQPRAFRQPHLVEPEVEVDGTAAAHLVLPYPVAAVGLRPEAAGLGGDIDAARDRETARKAGVGVAPQVFIGQRPQIESGKTAGGHLAQLQQDRRIRCAGVRLRVGEGRKQPHGCQREEKACKEFHAMGLEDGEVRAQAQRASRPFGSRKARPGARSRRYVRPCCVGLPLRCGESNRVGLSRQPSVRNRCPEGPGDRTGRRSRRRGNASSPAGIAARGLRRPAPPARWRPSCPAWCRA